ncbi:reverse transcriptase domain-containing protein [Tanacetum coccineum]
MIGMVFSHSNCTEDCKVKFATSTLTKDALSWWNSYAKTIGIEQADKIAWTELKRLLTNKYCPQTKVKKMEDEFYNLVVKGNDLKTYARRLLDISSLMSNLGTNTEKIKVAFIEGITQKLLKTVTASKPPNFGGGSTIYHKPQRLIGPGIVHCITHDLALSGVRIVTK